MKKMRKFKRMFKFGMIPGIVLGIGVIWDKSDWSMNVAVLCFALEFHPYA